MDSSRKRKAPPNATPSSAGEGASKKLKLLNSSAPKNNNSTSTSTGTSNVPAVGQKLLDQLHRATDKTGRHIATAFLELPSRDEYPDYYVAIRLPVALDTIADKLQRNAYPTVTTLESDLKRMVQNAKEYNAPKSDIFEDAERIRKLVYNFMKQNNPQYQEDPSYVSFATPIPQTDGAAKNGGHRNGIASGVESTRQSREVSERPKKIVLKNSEAPSDRKASVAPSTTTGDGGDDAEDDDEGGDGGDISFDGLGFQEAQMKLISYLLHYTEEGLEIYQPFGNLPSRKLEDYYRVIKHPVSLKGVRKLIQGIHGRNTSTGVTDFKTWDQFEEEVSYIWRNAQEYNETGSDMYNLSEEFREHFQSLLAEARAKVEEPSGPRIKLGGPKPKVTLNLTQNRHSPAPSASGVHVDNEALRRQREMVAAAGTSNGQQRPTTNGSARSGSQVPTIEPRPQSRQAGQSGSPLGTAFKAEKAPSQSPATQSAAPAVQPPATTTNGSMPPPSIRPPSASPFSGQTPGLGSGGYSYTAPSLLPPTALRPYPIEAALLPTVTLSTHPQLNIPRRFSMSLGPHPTLSQQSTTVTLPSTHYFLQIAPTISKQLSMGRPYKMFVTLNGTRLNQRDTQFHPETGKRTHVYEGSLAPGVNRIEVEVAASKESGKEEGKKEGLDVEKVTVFANLMR